MFFFILLLRGITEEVICSEWLRDTDWRHLSANLHPELLGQDVLTEKSPDRTWTKSHKKKTNKQTNLSCKRDNKKQTKCKAKGSGSSMKQKKQKKRRIRIGLNQSSPWDFHWKDKNTQRYHRCSDDWATWGSGGLAEVVRGSREGGGRGLEWRGVRTVSRWTQAGLFLCDGKQEEGKRRGTRWRGEGEASETARDYTWEETTSV